MDSPFLGPEAIAAGAITRSRLRWNFSAALPRVYVPNGEELQLLSRIQAVALWVGDGVVIAGLAAAFLHGVSWIDGDIPIEVITDKRRRWPGVIACRERIDDDEIAMVGALAVTSPARTAFDLARHQERDLAVTHLDGLAGVTGVTESEVCAIAWRYPGARWLRRAEVAIDLMDAGGQSPRETWLRLLVIDAGYPRPRTQIPVGPYFLDLGWDEPKIAMDYDGERHQADRRRYVRDLMRDEIVRGHRWTDLRVVKEHSRGFILHRLGTTWAAHGLPPAIRPPGR